jgi:hypothetical protein
MPSLRIILAALSRLPGRPILTFGLPEAVLGAEQLHGLARALGERLLETAGTFRAADLIQSQCRRYAGEQQYGDEHEELAHDGLLRDEEAQF